MFKVRIGIFEIRKTKIFDAINDIEVTDISTIQFIATQVVEQWWASRTIEIQGHTVDIADAFNARQLALSLAVEMDAKMVNTDDETFVVLADDLRSYTRQMRAETDRTMQTWDDAMEVIKTGIKAKLLTLIEAHAVDCVPPSEEIVSVPVDPNAPVIEAVLIGAGMIPLPIAG
jgi:hypothetical protein